jgi:hypothetical protein
MAPATVLVVDDDPVILKLLEVNFEMEGFRSCGPPTGPRGWSGPGKCSPTS